MVFRMALLVLSVVLVTGCTLVDSGVESNLEDDCPQGLARPFSAQTLIRVGNANGVSLKPNPEGCSVSGGRGEVQDVTNMLISESDDEVGVREGHVLCSVYDLPFKRPPFRAGRHRWPDDQETHFWVANVDCAIYPSGPGQIERLAMTFRALAAAPVEQRSCPQARPTPVTLQTLLRVAREHGLRLQHDQRCIEPGVVTQASTFLPYDRASILSSDVISQQQGEVTCLIRKSAQPGTQVLQTTTFNIGTRFDRLNVSCTVLPLNVDLYPEISAEQVARVRATMQAL